MSSLESCIPSRVRICIGVFMTRVSVQPRGTILRNAQYGIPPHPHHSPTVLKRRPPLPLPQGTLDTKKPDRMPTGTPSLQSKVLWLNSQKSSPGSSWPINRTCWLQKPCPWCCMLTLPGAFPNQSQDPRDSPKPPIPSSVLVSLLPCPTMSSLSCAT